MGWLLSYYPNISSQPLEERIFPERRRKSILEPLVVTDNLERFSISVKVSGGGYAGQAGAIHHGIARALVVSDRKLIPLLRTYGLLTRDPRVKERKKYGLVRARKAKQYTKR